MVEGKYTFQRIHSQIMALLYYSVHVLINKQRDEKVTRIRTRDTNHKETPLISFSAEVRMMIVTNPLLSCILSTAIAEIEGVAKKNDASVDNTDFKLFAEQSGIASCTKYKVNSNTLQAEISKFGASIRGADVVQLTNKIMVQEPPMNKWSPTRQKSLIVME